MPQDEIDASEVLRRVVDHNSQLQWVPIPPDDAITDWRKWPMRADGALDYLHNHWVLPDQFDSAVAGGGYKGALIRLVGRIVFRVLGPYLRQEREFLGQVVRMNDALARRCDELANEITERQIAEVQNDTRLAVWLHEVLELAKKDAEAESRSNAS